MFDEFIFETWNKITNCLRIHPFPTLHHFLGKPATVPSQSNGNSSFTPIQICLKILQSNARSS